VKARPFELGNMVLTDKSRRTKWQTGWRPVMAVICCFLPLMPVYGQQGEGQLGLKIIVVEGANARNLTQEIPLTPITVRVETATNKPVPNATVVFTSPESGASGEFANDSRIFSVNTNDEGLAIARGYHPNSITGAYSIQVRSTWNGETATTQIRQTNVAPGQGGLKKRIALVAIAGAVVAAIIAARGGSSSSGNTNSTPTITLGGGAVGAPR